MEAVGLTSSIIAIVEISAKLTALCLQYSREVKNAKQDIVRFSKQVTQLKAIFVSLTEALDGEQGKELKASQSVVYAVHDAETQLQGLCDLLDPSDGRKAMKRFGFRALKWPFDKKEVDEVLNSLQQPMSAISLALQVDHSTKLIEVDTKFVLNKLPVAAGARWDSYDQDYNAFCLPDTRVDLLSQVHDWVFDKTAKPIFWLNGMAGTGKSTISRTLARIFSDKGLLGASFFFKRNERDQDSLVKFFTTLAADMTVRQPFTSSTIKKSLDADSSLTTKSIHDQYNKLFLEPMSRMSADKPIVFVIDALDECERDGDVKLIIKLFSHVPTESNGVIRIFLTSRPELPPRLGFKAIEGSYQDMILHEIPEDVVAHDISVFLRHELNRIRDEFNTSVSDDRQLESTWPSQDNIDELTDMTIPLFIFAATVCLFIGDRNCGVPGELIKEVLEFQANQALELDQLDKTYRPVLDRLINGRSAVRQEKIIQQFRQIVGSIIVMAYPLPTKSLASLLGISQDSIEATLDLLHSVLRVPTSPIQPVRLLHMSFRDFLTDNNKKETNPFWIDEKEIHKATLQKCLDLLDKNLRENIGDISIPSDSSLDVSLETVKKNIPPHVKYACDSWVYHVEKAGILIGDNSNVHNFLKKHFLHWIEAMVMLRRTGEVIHDIRLLRSKVEPNTAEELCNLLDETIDLYVRYNFLIVTSPLQLYSSLVEFTGKDSIIRSLFGTKPRNMELLNPVQSQKNEQVRTVEVLDLGIEVLEFSPDSEMLACVSDRTVSISSATTGELLLEIECRPFLVCFAPDSKLVAFVYTSMLEVVEIRSGRVVFEADLDHFDAIDSVAFFSPTELRTVYSDGAVRSWDVETLAIRLVLKPSGLISELAGALSTDGTLVAVADYLGTTIHVKSLENGEVRNTIHTSRQVTVISFTVDSTHLVVSSDVGTWTVMVYSIATAECITISTSDEDAMSVAVSHDGSLIAFNKEDSGVEVYDNRTGDEVMRMPHRIIGRLTVSFSPDSKLLAWAGWDHPIAKICSVQRQEEPQQAHHHTGPVESISISSDLLLIATASEDKTVRIWNSSTGECVHILQGHTLSVAYVEFSHDSKLLISLSLDTTAKLWDPSTGNLVQTIHTETKEHKDASLSRDAKLLVTSYDDDKARVWDTQTGDCLQTIAGVGSGSHLFSFSVDAALIASAEGWTIKLWQRETVILLHELLGHTEEILYIIFSDDSKLLASSSRDFDIRIWSVETGLCLRIIHVYNRVYHLSFRPDYKALFTNLWSIDVHDMYGSPETYSKTLSKVQGYGIGANGHWLTWCGSDVFWIPAEARPCRGVVSGPLIVLGSNEGRVTILRVSGEPKYKDPKPWDLPNCDYNCEHREAYYKEWFRGLSPIWEEKVRRLRRSVSIPRESMDGEEQRAIKDEDGPTVEEVD